MERNCSQAGDGVAHSGSGWAEVFILCIVFSLWLAVIHLFLRRWGKIRLPATYIPDFDVAQREIQEKCRKDRRVFGVTTSESECPAG